MYCTVEKCETIEADIMYNITHFVYEDNVHYFGINNYPPMSSRQWLEIQFIEP